MFWTKGVQRRGGETGGQAHQAVKHALPEEEEGWQAMREYECVGRRARVRADPEGMHPLFLELTESLPTT